MKQHILLVEDNSNIRAINRRTLEMEGYRVSSAENLHRAEAVLEREPVDLIVLDILLPDGSGLDFCRRLRRRSAVPVLFLTAMGAKADVMAGLARGGDDYLVKPYDLDELVARIGVLLRRVNLDRGEDQVRFGPLTLDRFASRAYLDGEDVGLTVKEFGVLSYLLAHRHEAVTQEAIYEAVWGQPVGDTAKSVRTHISNLRKKLGLDGRADLEIETLYKSGYRIYVREKP